MLRQANLSRRLSKVRYKQVIDGLELRLGELQRRARESQIPVVLVFEGWDAAGKGTLINKLINALDPRGFNVYSTNPPTEDERLRPSLWRFWIRTPARGRIAVFDRSWYGRVLVERVDKLVKKKVWMRAFEEINTFERQLADDGTAIVKFFLHISKATQKKRFKILLANPATEWKVTKKDWRQHKQYRKYCEAIEEMLDRTHTAHAPWTLVEAHDERYATVKIFRAAIHAFEQAIARGEKKAAPRRARWTAPSGSVLDKMDLSPNLKRAAYEEELKKLQTRIWELEHEIYVHRIPVVILNEGSDAAGKGGNIKRMTRSMDPRGYEVVPIAAPNDVERSHHHLWRFWNKIPKAGHITIFDRTWYGRVLVERVEGFCAPEAWQRAYGEINDTEKLLADFGTVLIKFWYQIDKEEQLRRFEDRRRTPHKQWKITDEDWRNREKWDAYRRAVDDMLLLTHTAHAPWTLIEANCKLHARIKTLRTVVTVIEAALGK